MSSTVPQFEILYWHGTPVNINVNIKVHCNQNTFIRLEFLNSTIFDQKEMF